MVATPIGNLADVSLRAVYVLMRADLLACEDTRVTGQLLAHFGLDKPLLALQERIGYTFEKPALLQQAMTHRSFSSEHYERLEYLGDAVINVIVATSLSYHCTIHSSMVGSIN